MSAGGGFCEHAGGNGCGTGRNGGGNNVKLI